MPNSFHTNQLMTIKLSHYHNTNGPQGPFNSPGADLSKGRKGLGRVYDEMKVMEREISTFHDEDTQNILVVQSSDLSKTLSNQKYKARNLHNKHKKQPSILSSYEPSNSSRVINPQGLMILPPSTMQLNRTLKERNNNE